MKYHVRVKFKGYEDWSECLDYVNELNEGILAASARLEWKFGETGIAYFKHEEDAIAFRLRFGL